MVFNAFQITSDKCKQIGRFIKWVFPCHPVLLTLFATLNVVTIREQNWIVLLIRFNRRTKFGEHVGTVEIPGNMSKALGFTLGTKHTARFVQTLKRRIVLRFDRDLSF